LLAGEEVDLPLFFFIDKDYAEDESMADIDDIVLSYTFFRLVVLIFWSVELTVFSELGETSMVN